ncbi:hypothetical protein CCR75_007401 [Bremia lactucae]|uniref:Serine aminopeptidase S33 domain-containing protein n=1 Tax=Bremia lactucae TaxID=4779 RepID=A0A976ILL6_BRELC|nr:hypothetical protein CCR75_007401 [Bremia lactucae]
MATRGRVNSALRAQHMPNHFRHFDGTFTNTRGQKLSYLALFPPTSAPLRAVVLYLHGIGDHSRRYFHLYERLCTAGFGVLAYDLVSHGASDSDRHGLRAHSSRFQNFVDDTNEFISMAKSELYPKVALSLDTEPKMILSGMSYGTLVSLHTILSGTHHFSGVVLVAPALLVEMTPVLRVQAAFARPLSKLMPKARIVPGVNTDFLCRDPDYLEDFKADPLTVTEPVTARMGAETLKAMKALEVDKRIEDDQSALCRLPMLMMMGSNDKVTSLELAQVFFERLAASDKEFKIFEDYFHALFDDPEHDAVFDHLDNWLKTRFPFPESVLKDTIEEGEKDAEVKPIIAEVGLDTMEKVKDAKITSKESEISEASDGKVQIPEISKKVEDTDDGDGNAEIVAIVKDAEISAGSEKVESIETSLEADVVFVSDEVTELSGKAELTDVGDGKVENIEIVKELKFPVVSEKVESVETVQETKVAVKSDEDFEISKKSELTDIGDGMTETIEIIEELEVPVASEKVDTVGISQETEAGVVSQEVKEDSKEKDITNLSDEKFDAIELVKETEMSVVSEKIEGTETSQEIEFSVVNDKITDISETTELIDVSDGKAEAIEIVKRAENVPAESEKVESIEKSQETEVVVVSERDTEILKEIDNFDPSDVKVETSERPKATQKLNEEAGTVVTTVLASEKISSDSVTE